MSVAIFFSNGTLEVALPSAMKIGQRCFSLRTVHAISSAIQFQDIDGDCACDAAVHSTVLLSTFIGCCNEDLWNYFLPRRPSVVHSSWNA